MDSKITLANLKKMKQAGEKIACMTAYDASMAHWVSKAGIEVILVGDSLGMVVQGHETTLPVSLEEMIYHAQIVQRGNSGAWCIADLPFMTDADLPSALHSAARLMKEGLVNMVKLEGGQRVLETVKALSDIGVPVCGHLGLLPQSVQKKGYQMVGKEAQAAALLLEEAKALEKAGAEMLVLECVPRELAGNITQALSIPVIGIGSGELTDGQVLVITDALGITVGSLPRFSKNFLADTDGCVLTALETYFNEVKAGAFPDAEHCLA